MTCGFIKQTPQGIVVASAQGIVVEVKLKLSRDLFPNAPRFS
jgi:hypothetical protein